MKPRRRTDRMAAALAIAALLLGAGCSRTEHEEEETKAKAVPGRVVLQPGAAQRAGITTAVAGPASIDVSVQLPGEVKPDSSRMLIVRPRFPGVVHAMSKSVGASVRRGETVARVQSNESLTDYAIPASMPGRVVARGAAVGEVVSQDTPLYTILDLSDVWVEFAVYPQDLAAIRQGQYVLIRSESPGGPIASGRIAYLGPALAEGTPISTARVILPNRTGNWKPGLIVTVSVITDEVHAPVAVPEQAIVRTDEGPVVFVADAQGFQERRVVTGRSDGKTTEIVSGLAAGTRIAVDNAFVLKAELEKTEYGE